MSENFKLKLVKDIVSKISEKINFNSFSLVALELNFTEEETEKINNLVMECSRTNENITKKHFKEKIEVILNEKFEDYSRVDLILSGFKSDWEIAENGNAYKFIEKMLNVK